MVIARLAAMGFSSYDSVVLASYQSGRTPPASIAAKHSAILRRLVSQAIYKMVLKRAEQAGVKAFSADDLRRSFVSDVLDAGADIATVQQLAGQAGIATTARYDRQISTAI